MSEVNSEVVGVIGSLARVVSVLKERAQSYEVLNARDPATIQADDVTVVVYVGSETFRVSHEHLKFESAEQLLTYGRRSLRQEMLELLGVISNMVRETLVAEAKSDDEAFAAIAAREDLAATQQDIAELIGCHPEDMAGRGPVD